MLDLINQVLFHIIHSLYKNYSTRYPVCLVPYKTGTIVSLHSLGPNFFFTKASEYYQIGKYRKTSPIFCRCQLRIMLLSSPFNVGEPVLNELYNDKNDVYKYWPVKLYICHS